jgi:hypothetical protein
MRRRALSLAAGIGLLAVSLLHPAASPIAASSCEECADRCNQIPMDPEECLQLYCPECAGASAAGAGTNRCQA